MNIYEIIAGLIITASWTISASLNKNAVLKGCSPSDISFSNSIWMSFGVVTVMVMTWNTEFVPFFAKGEAIIIPFIVSALKGISVYAVARSLAQIAKKSISSGVFALTSGLPIGTIVAVFLLGEKLGKFDILAVIIIGVLSFMFFIKGHAKHLSRADKIAYIVLVCAVTYNMVADRVVAVGYSWAVHLAIYNTSWLLIGYVPRLIKMAKKHGHASFTKKPLTYPPLMMQGASYLFVDVFFIYVSQHVFHGIVLPFIFLRLATPLIMMVGCLRYGEGNWREQFVFGLSILVPVALVIFF